MTQSLLLETRPSEHHPHLVGERHPRSPPAQVLEFSAPTFMADAGVYLTTRVQGGPLGTRHFLSHPIRRAEPSSGRVDVASRRVACAARPGHGSLELQSIKGHHLLQGLPGSGRRHLTSERMNWKWVARPHVGWK